MKYPIPRPETELEMEYQIKRIEGIARAAFESNHVWTVRECIRSLERLVTVERPFGDKSAWPYLRSMRWMYWVLQVYTPQMSHKIEPRKSWFHRLFRRST